MGGEVVSRVDVTKGGQKRNGMAAQVGKRISQRVCARPADASERPRDMWPTFQPDKPVAAIRRRTQHRIMAAEQAKGGGDVRGCDVRDVGANDDHRSGRSQVHEPLHAGAKIATALREKTRARRPDAGRQCTIRRHREQRVPGAATLHPLHEGGDAVAGEAQRHG